MAQTSQGTDSSNRSGKEALTPFITKYGNELRILCGAYAEMAPRRFSHLFRMRPTEYNPIQAWDVDKKTGEDFYRIESEGRRVRLKIRLADTDRAYAFISVECLLIHRPMFFRLLELVFPNIITLKDKKGRSRKAVKII